MIEIQPVNTTYEPFSLEREYIEANRGFVGLRDLSGVERFLDLACGTGTVSEHLVGAAPAAHLNGVDLDPVQIGLAVEKFRSLAYATRVGFELTDEVVGDKPVLVFGVGPADDLPFPDASFDCVTICNAIHVIPERDRLLGEVGRVLRPGGLFGFNSAFYAGTYPAGTENHYFEWGKLAIGFINEMNERRRDRNEEPIRRRRGTAHKAFQNRWLSKPEWTEALRQHGFSVATLNERTVMLDARCFAAVGAYGGLAEVLVSGYPVEISSLALQSTAKRSLDVMGVEALPRLWLEMWATKD